MTLATAPLTRRRPTPMILRWLALIEMHGSHTAALHALIRRADELERLQLAVRSLGMSPELLAAQMRERED